MCFSNVLILLPHSLSLTQPCDIVESSTPPNSKTDSMPGSPGTNGAIPMALIARLASTVAERQTEVSWYILYTVAFRERESDGVMECRWAAMHSLSSLSLPLSSITDLHFRLLRTDTGVPLCKYTYITTNSPLSSSLNLSLIHSLYCWLESLFSFFLPLSPSRFLSHSLTLWAIVTQSYSS